VLWHWLLTDRIMMYLHRIWHVMHSERSMLLCYQSHDTNTTNDSSVPPGITQLLFFIRSHATVLPSRVSRTCKECMRHVIAYNCFRHILVICIVWQCPFVCVGSLNLTLRLGLIMGQLLERSTYQDHTHIECEICERPRLSIWSAYMYEDTWSSRFGHDGQVVN
jgi:hypothetical protein